MPKPRSASLRVAHSRSCPCHGLTALNPEPKNGTPVPRCTCKPSYYTFHRGADGKPVKGPRVRDRQVADRALRKLQVEIDEGRVDSGRRAKPLPTFGEWSDTYVDEILPGRGSSDSTVKAYRATLGYALPVLRPLELDLIDPSAIRRVVEAIKSSGSSDATLAKHLRHLGAVFHAAEDEFGEGRFRSPLTRKYIKSLKLRVPKGNPPYTDLELAALWAKMETLEYEPVYLNVCKASVVTGARQGELIGMNWGDLDLLRGKLEIRAEIAKDAEARTVSLIPPAVALLEAWAAEQGVQPDDAPLFQAPRSKDRLNGQYLTKLVNKAIGEAKLPKVGEGGRKRKPFHAFRATYTRLCRERGLDPQWVQDQLGHSDPRLTLDVYGKWSDTAIAAEAAKVEAEGFPV
jgi:integrase